MDESPCRCWEKGCEHLMSWHRAVASDRAVCDVPGCFCYTETICGHTVKDKPEDAGRFFASLGIADD